MNIVGNLIWLIFGGIIIAIEYFIGSIVLMITIVGIILCLTIIGIPFGLQHFKLTAIALSPFGREIVSK
jgi:uncharacterized membrane protein YccF (DUF307 family)